MDVWCGHDRNMRDRSCGIAREECAFRREHCERNDPDGTMAIRVFVYGYASIVQGAAMACGVVAAEVHQSWV